MGSESIEEYKKLVNEISKGMDQVKQLIAASSSSSGNQERALEKRLTSYEEALSILSEMDPGTRNYQRRRPRVETISTIRVSGNSDDPPDDGYNWRKYGQKGILGSKYPRSYYRCSHKFDRGCQATKQVQKLNEDPGEIEIVYRSTHTCVGPVNKPPPPKKHKPPPPEKQLDHPEVEDSEDESSFTVGR